MLLINGNKPLLRWFRNCLDQQHVKHLPVSSKILTLAD